MTSHPTDDELEAISDANAYKESMMEYQTKYHELRGAMCRIHWILCNPTGYGYYHDDEIISGIKRIVEELDI